MSMTQHRIVMVVGDPKQLPYFKYLKTLDSARRADIVIDSDGTVIKDRDGVENRPATDEEINAAFVIGADA